MKLKMNIEKKLVALVAVSMVLVFIALGSICFYSIYNIKQIALQTDAELGDFATERTSHILELSAEGYLRTLAKEKANFSEDKIQELSTAVHILGDKMTNIISNPDEYKMLAVAEPKKENDGVLMPQVLYAESADKNHLQGEIGLTANIQNHLQGVVRYTDGMSSAYVASQNGFIIMADKISGAKFTEGSSLPIKYEASSRPWYQRAMTGNEQIFTDVFFDVNGGGCCLVCAEPYYCNGDFAGVVGIGAYLQEIADIVLNTKIGDTGYTFILNKEGQIISSPTAEGELVFKTDEIPDLRQSNNASLAAVAKKMAAGEAGLGQVTINGKEYYISYEPMPTVGWSFAALIEKDEVLAPAAQGREDILAMTSKEIFKMDGKIANMLKALFLSAIVLLLILVYTGRKMARQIVKPVKQLITGVKLVGKGDFSQHIDINTGDEIELLANKFNEMGKKITMYMEGLTKATAEKERVSTEMNVANHIQANMLPCIFPAFPDREEFDLYATMKPAKDVGGDFYDFYMIDEDHLLVVIADVSGKGVPAALFMVIAKTIMKNFAASWNQKSDFAEIMSGTNKQLNENNEEMMFVTAFMGMLNIKTGLFTYVNAGHNPPIIYRKEMCTCKYLSLEKNCVLGIDDDAVFVSQSLQLHSGDMLYLYTDGVTEAMDEKGILYSEDQLLQVMNSLDMTLPVSMVLEKIRESLSSHTKGAMQSDDITMLGLKVK